MKPKHIITGESRVPAGTFALANPAVHTGDRSRFGRKDANTELLEVKKAVQVQKSALEKSHGDLKTAFTEMETQLKSTGEVSEQTKAQLTEFATKFDGHIEKFESLEQELAKVRENHEQKREALKSHGQKFVETERFKNLQARDTKSATMDLKSITSATTGTGDAGVLIEPQRVPGVITQPDRPMFLRDLLSPGETTSNAIEYVRETGFTNAAAPVAEGALKPESSIEFELLTAPIRTIAHWMIASMQVLADVPMLRSFIDQRLRSGS